MTNLTPNDVRRWDTTAVLRVFQVANARAGTLQTFGEDLGQVGQLLAEWEGEAGAAFHSSLGKARADIEADGHESAKIGAAVSASLADVQACKATMSKIDATAESVGFNVTEGWKVDIGNASLLMGSEVAELQRQILQTDLDTLKVKAHATDHELAAAMRAAVGDAGLNSYQDHGNQLSNSTDPDQTARRLAQERLDDLKNSTSFGPPITDPIMGGDSRTRAEARRQFQRLLESGQPEYPSREFSARSMKSEAEKPPPMFCTTLRRICPHTAARWAAELKVTVLPCRTASTGETPRCGRKPTLRPLRASERSSPKSASGWTRSSQLSTSSMARPWAPLRRN
jgi:uncharacterized protein YukE